MAEEAETNDGYIYIIFNEMYKFYGEDVYKIGKAVDINQRINAYTTSYVQPVEVKFLSESCKNYTLAERAVFSILKNYRIRSKREFFKGNIQVFIDTIEQVVAYVNNNRITDKANNPPRHTEVDDDIVDEDLFDQYVNAPADERNDGEYESIHSLIQKYNLPDGNLEMMIKYKDIFTDPNKSLQPGNIIKLFVDYHYIDHATCVSNMHTKIDRKVNLIKMVEHTLANNIQKITHIETKIEHELSRFEHVRTLFRTTKQNPLNMKDLMKSDVDFIRKYCCNNVIVSKKVKARERCNMVSYHINTMYCSSILICISTAI